MKKNKILLITLFNLHTFCYSPEVLINHVKECISKAEKGISKLTSHILNIDGMSSAKGRHFLNNLCSLPNATYLEIGVWKGSTFISALMGNEATILKATAIDNWSQFGGPQQEFIRNTKLLKNTEIFNFLDQDCFAINLAKNFSIPINIYFYDGDHTAEAQKLAFTYYNALFEEYFIAVIDDWNYPPVSIGTRRAFKELNYTILYEKALPARFNGDKQNWWNGLYVAVIKKN